jgi:hypothetical protein
VGGAGSHRAAAHDKNSVPPPGKPVRPYWTSASTQSKDLVTAFFQFR